MTTYALRTILIALLLTAICPADPPDDIDAEPVDKWMTVTGVAAGEDLTAEDEAVAQALRQAVEQACGVFLTSQSEAVNYQAVYDKIFADTVGFVREHEVLDTWTEDGKTCAKVRARVSTQQFAEDWAVIAHTVNQENNPRVVVAILENVTDEGDTTEVDEAGAVQGIIEDYFLQRGITLMDRETAADVTKRDVLLAALSNDEDAVASLGARFDADVVVTGRASAKFGKKLNVAGVEMFQFTATMNIRIIQTDSGVVLVSKTLGPTTTNTLQRGGGADEALTALAEESAPEILTAVVDAWRERAHVSRTVALTISGMDYAAWKVFKTEMDDLRGVQAVRLREITQSVAHIDVEYDYDNEILADNLLELTDTSLEVSEITANRIKLAVVADE